jgi:hypothetical protein
MGEWAWKFLKSVEVLIHAAHTVQYRVTGLADLSDVSADRRGETFEGGLGAVDLAVEIISASC